MSVTTTRLHHVFAASGALILMLAFGCTTITGKSAMTNVDDAATTARVKASLAAAQLPTVTRVDVDTNKGTVYLTGNVGSGGVKERATEIARNVNGVERVVNNLRIMSAAPR